MSLMEKLRPGRVGQARPGRVRREPVPRVPLGSRAALARVSVGLLCLLLIAVVLEVAVIGTIRHARAQALAHQTLRDSLAHGETPVGQLDGNGVLVKLGTPIARIKIPALNVDTTVLEGSTSSVLADGPGHRRDTPYPGQPGTSLILGRQAAYGGDFGGIGSLKAGDTIWVTTGQGLQHFVVTGLRHPGDKAMTPPAGTSRLTLASADGFPFMSGSTIRVDADLVGQAVASGSHVFDAKSLSHEEQIMAGDSSAALPLYLWAQLLLIAALVLVWVRSVWGRWQTWLVAVPVLLLCCMQIAHELAMYLPNLL